MNGILRVNDVLFSAFVHVDHFGKHFLGQKSLFIAGTQYHVVLGLEEVEAALDGLGQFDEDVNVAHSPHPGNGHAFGCGQSSGEVDVVSLHSTQTSALQNVGPNIASRRVDHKLGVVRHVVGGDLLQVRLNASNAVTLIGSDLVPSAVRVLPHGKSLLIVGFHDSLYLTQSVAFKSGHSKNVVHVDEAFLGSLEALTLDVVPQEPR